MMPRAEEVAALMADMGITELQAIRHLRDRAELASRFKRRTGGRGRG